MEAVTKVAKISQKAYCNIYIYFDMENLYCNTYCDAPGIIISVYYYP